MMRLQDGDKLSDKVHAFNLLLRKTKDILLSPRAKLAIPICFSPESMIKCEAICYVTALRKDGLPFDSHGQNMIRPYGKEMKWAFTVIGIPEFNPSAGKSVATIECKARSRVEEILQLSFTESLSNSGNFENSNVLSNVIVKQPSSLSEIGSGYSLLPEEFAYEFEFADVESHGIIERSVGINLVLKKIHKVSGAITLVFLVVFSPYKAFR